MKYLLIIKNNYSNSDHLVSGFIGGISLDDNLYSLPDRTLKEFYKLAEKSLGQSVILNIFIGIELDRTQIQGYLSKLFVSSYKASVKEKYWGTGAPGMIKSIEFFNLLTKAIAPDWLYDDFKTTQKGDTPIVECHLCLSGETGKKVMLLTGWS